jgi:hypothetical protein
MLDSLSLLIPLLTLHITVAFPPVPAFVQDSKAAIAKVVSAKKIIFVFMCIIKSKTKSNRKKPN